MAGVKGRSGRKRKSITREQAMRSLTLRLPKAIEVIAETMEGVNRDRLRYEAAMAIKDAVLGKPKVVTDLQGGEGLGAGMVAEVLRVAAEVRRRELEVKRALDEKQVLPVGVGDAVKQS